MLSMAIVSSIAATSSASVSRGSRSSLYRLARPTALTSLKTCGPNCAVCDRDGGSRALCSVCMPGFGLAITRERCRSLLHCENQCVPCEVEFCHSCSEQAAGTCHECKVGYVLQSGKCIYVSQIDEAKDDMNTAVGEVRDTGNSAASAVKGTYPSRLREWIMPVSTIYSMTDANHKLSTIGAIVAVTISIYALAATYRFAVKPVRLDPATLLPEDGLSDHILACRTTPSIFCWACCCPCVRWSDTISLAGYLPFFVALTLWVVLLLANLILLGLGLPAVMVLGIVFRQTLRSSFGLPQTSMTLAKDVIAWVLCLPCAIAQEARHVERGLDRLSSV